MPQPTDPRILTNKNQAMLVVLKNTIDDMSSGDVSALRADSSGNLLTTDHNLSFSGGRLLVDTEASAAVVSQTINGLINMATPSYELVPNIGPAPTADSKWMGYVQFESTGTSNHDVEVNVFHYIEKAFMSYEKILVATKTVSPPIGGTIKVPFNQFDLTYDPTQVAPCNAALGIECNCIITNSDTIIVTGKVQIFDGVTFVPA